MLAGWWLNIEQGPAIVLVLGAVFAVAFLLGPKYGLLGRARGGKTQANG